MVYIIMTYKEFLEWHSEWSKKLYGETASDIIAASFLFDGVIKTMSKASLWRKVVIWKKVRPEILKLVNYLEKFKHKDKE